MQLIRWSGWSGRPLLEKVMEAGRRLPGTAPSLSEIHDVARREIELLPDGVRSIELASQPYPVELSPKLAAYAEEVAGVET